MLFASFSQKLDLVEDIFPDTFSTTHLGSVISLFMVVVRGTAIAFLLLSCARRSVNWVRLLCVSSPVIAELWRPKGPPSGAPYSYGKEKETCERIFSWLS